MNIVEDDLTGGPVLALLERHMAHMRSLSPPESVHALDLSGLRGPEITFWTVWDGADLVGCGALKQIDPAHGEIKSMHTAAEHRGRGVAAAMLAHILAEARRRGYRRLSLETGSMDGFIPARMLYARNGFFECPPFDDYAEDPNSTFMTFVL